MSQSPDTSRIRQAQAGVMLLEALIAILIFSLGILSLVALQATSMQLASDARYRTDAGLLANKLLGQMWASGYKPPELPSHFSSPDGDAYRAWRDHDVMASGALPDIAAAAGGGVSTLPEVTVDNTGQVAITLYWRTPQMNPDERHRHVVTSQIVQN